MTIGKTARSGLVLVGLVVASGGCRFMSGQPPTQLYVLSSLADTPSAAPADEPARGIAVGVAPVDLPRYLERGDIVTRSGQNELQVDRFRRWAGPLRYELARVIAADLGVLLPSGRAVALPYNREFPLDYEVRVRVSRFERTAVTGEVVLDASWAVLDFKEQRPLLAREARIRVPSGADYAAIAAAMSQAAAELAGDIGNELRGLRPPPPA